MRVPHIAVLLLVAVATGCQSGRQQPPTTTANAQAGHDDGKNDDSDDDDGDDSGDGKDGKDGKDDGDQKSQAELRREVEEKRIDDSDCPMFRSGADVAFAT